MARIKKKGLDYFPLNTDFIHDRAVRRLMKREGDSALGILVEILSYIYAGNRATHVPLFGIGLPSNKRYPDKPCSDIYSPHDRSTYGHPPPT